MRTATLLAILSMVALWTFSARADMLTMFGGARGGGVAPTCAVNLSTKLNDKCSSIFAKGRM